MAKKKPKKIKDPSRKPDKGPHESRVRECSNKRLEYLRNTQAFANGEEFIEGIHADEIKKEVGRRNVLRKDLHALRAQRRSQAFLDQQARAALHQSTSGDPRNMKLK